jgi:outer membrane protein OmpA-like peptidoglycan-associated protein
VSSQTDGFSSGGSSISGSFSPVDRALQDLGAKTVGNEMQIDLPADVLFDFDKSNIRPDAATALNHLLTIIKAQTGKGQVRIEGHTDAIADAAYNQKLSERRANSVKTWLIDRGIATARLTTRGLGESTPIAANTNPDCSDNPSGRQKNRRVQVTIEK